MMISLKIENEFWIHHRKSGIWFSLENVTWVFSPVPLGSSFHQQFFLLRVFIHHSVFPYHECMYAMNTRCMLYTPCNIYHNCTYGQNLLYGMLPTIQFKMISFLVAGYFSSHKISAAAYLNTRKIQLVKCEFYPHSTATKMLNLCCE